MHLKGRTNSPEPNTIRHRTATASGFNRGWPLRHSTYTTRTASKETSTGRTQHAVAKASNAIGVKADEDRARDPGGRGLCWVRSGRGMGRCAVSPMRRKAATRRRAANRRRAGDAQRRQRMPPASGLGVEAAGEGKGMSTSSNCSIWNGRLEMVFFRRLLLRFFVPVLVT
jgi:hypothetical protein